MSRLFLFPGRIALMTAAMGSPLVAQSDPPRQGPPLVLEVRLATDKATPGFTVKKNLEGGDKPGAFFLRSDNVVSDGDMIRARTKPSPDGLVIEIQLSDAAAARLRATTASNVGKQMAVLARGQLATAATIMGPIPTGNRVTLGLTLPRAAADSVRSQVAARWPRREQ